MLAFAPSSTYYSVPLRQPQVYRHQLQRVSPRDRYLAALAEARSAEDEYVAALGREKEQREEEERLKLVLQRKREDAIRRQLLLEDALSSQNSATPFMAEDPYSGYQRYSQIHAFDWEAEAEIAVLRKLERRRAAIRRQEEVAKRQRLVILRHQQEELEQAKALAMARRAAKLREQETRSSCRSEKDLQEVLSVLFGERATACKESPQEKLVQPQAKASTGCKSERVPRDQAVNNEQGDVEQLLGLIFGGQSNAEHSCHCAPKEEAKENTTQESQACQFQRSVAQKPQDATSAPTPGTSSRLDTSLKDELQSRLTHEPESEVRDALQGLISSIFGPAAKLARKERVEKKNKDVTAGSPSSSGLSLKEQLEARLHKDPNVEVHDTIQAILTSLMTTPQGVQAPTPSSDVKAKADTPTRASSSTTDTGVKGKGKAVSFDIAADITPTSKDVVESMNAIQNIQATFNTLSTDFSFPTRLDFTPASSVPSSPHASDSESVSTSQLAYTSTNAPVHYYEQALSALLSQLDAVESWGNEEVRKGRKELVAKVEAALEEVEKEVQERFVQRQARNVGSIPVEVKEGKVEEKVQSNEGVVVEPSSGAPAEKAAAVAEAADISAAVEGTSASADQQSMDDETVPGVGFNSSDRSLKFDDNFKETVIDVPVSTFVSQSPVSQVVTSSTEEFKEAKDSSLTHSNATTTFADGDPHDKEENGEEHASFSVASQNPSVSVDADRASPNGCITPAESEPVDTFLLPAAVDSPVVPKRPAFNEEDALVVIDGDHEEASDGENWSEVEA